MHKHKLATTWWSRKVWLTSNLSYKVVPPGES